MRRQLDAGNMTGLTARGALVRAAKENTRYIAIDDEENASAKGKPNMTATTFRTWLE